MSDINATVQMLIDQCEANPSAALAIAQRSAYVVAPGRHIIDAKGVTVCRIEKGTLSPHQTDVLALLICKLLNEHHRHTEGK